MKTCYCILESTCDYGLFTTPPRFGWTLDKSYSLKASRQNDRGAGSKELDQFDCLEDAIVRYKELTEQIGPAEIMEPDKGVFIARLRVIEICIREPLGEGSSVLLPTEYLRASPIKGEDLLHLHTNAELPADEAVMAGMKTVEYQLHELLQQISTLYNSESAFLKKCPQRYEESERFYQAFRNIGYLHEAITYLKSATRRSIEDVQNGRL